MATKTAKSTGTRAGKLDLTDRKLMNLIQSRFPMTERPYLDLANELGTSEEDVLARLGRLRKANIVRQIGAIFDTRRLGYKTTLVAFRYPKERLDAAAQRINQHPGVSHNYERDGYFNLWFTLAVPPHEELDTVIASMAEETGAESARTMPTIRFFKIGVNFDMVKQESAAYEYYSPDGYGKAARPSRRSRRRGPTGTRPASSPSSIGPSSWSSRRTCRWSRGRSTRWRSGSG
ncbi:MAG: AsnC family transcriptional regulator [Chloroflexi bacterium]|nr:AsnC family transcriptional regulator [Chloroflexota bacterium]